MSTTTSPDREHEYLSVSEVAVLVGVATARAQD
jgi:hypothetical protein